MTLLSRDELTGLLDELGAELERQGVHGDLFVVVGGAAMALAYNTRRSTRDLDAVFEPKHVVYEDSCQATIPMPQLSSNDPDCLSESLRPTTFSR
ncbi:MAG TPA: DUF6036 family nucleotidyltransferase [Candidatus Limnocylindrales bacterium]